MTGSLLIDGALVWGETGFRTGGVLVEGERITAVAWTDDERRDLQARAAETLSADAFWLIPGLIDAHAHGYSTLLRGTENSLPLELWALYTTLYGRAYDARTIRAAVLLGAAERIRGGVTGVIDHAPMVHFAEAALAAHEQSGLRVRYAAFLHDISDYDLLEMTLPPLLAGGLPRVDADVYSARFAEILSMARGGSGRVSVQLGPNAPQRCSPDAWALWRTLRDRLGVKVHVHLMETHVQAEIGRRRGTEGLVAEMERFGLLEGGLSAAHGIWLSEMERERLARHGVSIVHNPASNLMLGSGIMPLGSYRVLGATVALGTDSANTSGRHDMFETMRLALMLPRIGTTEHEAWPLAEEILTMATRNGARVLGLEGQVGSIEAGRLADLALVRHGHPTTLAMRRDAAALVQHGSPEAVDSVMVNGIWVMRDRRILAFDEAAALREAADVIGELRERTATDRVVLDGALPALSESFRAVQLAFLRNT
jgi:5-methylthioadenosine/S-adenosylhomocysteine deaminase